MAISHYIYFPVYIAVPITAVLSAIITVLIITCIVSTVTRKKARKTEAASQEKLDKVYDLPLPHQQTIELQKYEPKNEHKM